MRKNTKGKRFLALVLAAVLMLSVCPVTASAEADITGACSHHPNHTEDCGYVEGQACTHDCNDGTCSKQEAVPAVDCDKNCVDTDGDGQIDHADECAYTPGTEEVKCDHDHNSECGYTEGHDCNFECEICQNDQKQIEQTPTIQSKAKTQETRAAHEGSLDYGFVAVDAENKVIDRDLAALAGNTKFNCVNNEKLHTRWVNCKISAEEFTSIAQNKIPSGYTLIGYYQGFLPNGKIAVTPMGTDDITVPTAATPFYFVVQKQYTYTISYDTQGSTAVASTTTTSAQEAVTLNVTESTPTREGYTFKGWAESADATEANAESSYTLTKDSPQKTLYAVWEQNSPATTYTVTYKDGVDKTVFDDEVFSGLKEGTSTPSFERTLTREGYTFDGWSPKVAETVTENAIYTATWKPNKPTTQYLESINSAVYVKCSRSGARLFKLNEGSYTIGEVTHNAEGGYSCTVTVNASTYVEDYSRMELKDHRLADGEQASKTFTLKFNDEEGKWEPEQQGGGSGLVSFSVICENSIDVDWNELEISKKSNKNDVRIGETVTYTVTVKNKTSHSLANVYVAEEPDANLEILSMTSEDGTCDSDEKLWTILSLEAGGEASMTVTARVKVTSATIVTNTAAITRAKVVEDGSTHPLLSGLFDTATVSVTNSIETGYEAYFFIRTDNSILNNPDAEYSPSEYIPVPTGNDRVGWTAIQNALKEQKACSKPEDISANLLNQPTIDQIVSQLSDNNIAFNKERDLINWYVIKYDEYNDQWHVDGSIVYRWWVNYDANDGNGPVPESSLHENDTTVDVSFASNPTREGYTFLGWAKTKDATEPNYPVNENGTFTMPKEDVILYAVWKQNKSYTVSYEVTGTSPEGYTVPEGATVPEGSNYTVANVPESQKGTLEGKAGIFTFEGWTYDGTKITELTNIQKDVVLQGIWTFTPDATDPEPSKPTEPDPTVPDPTDPEPEWGKLTIDKSANRTTVRPGKTITYTIKVTNRTGEDLEDIVVSEKLDANLTFVSASGDGNYAVKDGLWTISELKNGKTAKLTIKATVKSGVKNGTVIKNTVVITEAGGDPVPGTPSDTVKVTVSNKISLIPETGDTSNIGLWIGVLVACAVVLGVVLILTVKKKKTR